MALRSSWRLGNNDPWMAETFQKIDISSRNCESRIRFGDFHNSLLLTGGSVSWFSFTLSSWSESAVLTTSFMISDEARRFWLTSIEINGYSWLQRPGVSSEVRVPQCWSSTKSLAGLPNVSARSTRELGQWHFVWVHKRPDVKVILDASG